MVLLQGPFVGAVKKESTVLVVVVSVLSADTHFADNNRGRRVGPVFHFLFAAVERFY